MKLNIFSNVSLFSPFMQAKLSPSFLDCYLLERFQDKLDASICKITADLTKEIKVLAVTLGL